MRWLALFVAGCVDASLVPCDADFDPAFCDAGMTPGVECRTASDCLNVSGRMVDCRWECANGNCVIGTSPDGTSCALGERRCLGGSCELPRCGDGFVDRTAGSLEYCDDGNMIDGDGCDANCARTCVAPAPRTCGQLAEEPCAPPATCAFGIDDLCHAEPALPDGTACELEGDEGHCEWGRCFVHEP